MKRIALATGLVLAVGLATGTAQAQTFKGIRVANGVSGAIFVTHAPKDFKRIFIAQQGSGTSANILIMDITTNTLLGTPYLTVTGLTTGGERGLLGLAFHPEYNANGYVYTSYTNTSGHSEVVRFTRDAVDPNKADPSTAFKIINQNQPFSNHNGGWIAFGPDNYLYYALGDGGSGGDPQGNGQNINTLLGKMLRLDVNGDDFTAPELNYAIPPTNPFAGATPGRDEIWHFGLRNHWRNSFDRVTGDLYLGDVGQESWEEVSVQPANDPAAKPGDPGYQGGKNYGWRCMEGLHCTGLSGCECNGTALTNPVWEFSSQNGSGNCSVTGGYVYRGCAIPELQGHYLFADYCSNKIWSFQWTGGPITGVVDRTATLAPGGGVTINSVTSFGEDAYGEIYLTGGGEVFKIVPIAPTPDCNENGKADACDILDGSSLDANSNGIPDECEQEPCYAECDGDGELTIDDFICYQTLFALGDPAADCDGDTVLSIDDFICFQTAFALGC